ncbi:MAG: hypothetical protein IJX25_03665 [Clostridia bacterium]|nr:hypothetical protein [Clostridia bacterium]MBQ8792168.1 hypothetical protein [Clostridia bacterium]
MSSISLLGYYYLNHLTFLNETYKVLPEILWCMLALVGGAGCVYAIILGVNLAKAESEDKRKQASTRLRNTIIGVATLLILVLFINVLLPLILKAIWPDSVFDSAEAYQEWLASKASAGT